MDQTKDSKKKTNPNVTVDPGVYQTLATEEHNKESSEGGQETVNRGTSMPKLPPCSCPETRAYTLGEHMGGETRHHEFKTGFLHGGRLKQKAEFIPFVGRYLCAFLNSGGGVMYFGVDDSGVVKGVRLTDGEREDFLRWIRLIFTKEITMTNGDPAQYDIGDLDPQGHLYSVTFSKVYATRDKGTPKEKRELEENLTVVEICIHPCQDGERYKFRDKTFSRRDASCRFPKEENPHLSNSKGRQNM